MTTKEYARRYVELELSHLRLLDAIRPLVFVAESVAHLKHLERELLPACDAANSAIRAAESLA